jgi:hypothetical protein
MMPVFTHDRCMNCHGEVIPSTGENHDGALSIRASHAPPPAAIARPTTPIRRGRMTGRSPSRTAGSRARTRRRCVSRWRIG